MESASLRPVGPAVALAGGPDAPRRRVDARCDGRSRRRFEEALDADGRPAEGPPEREPAEPLRCASPAPRDPDEAGAVLDLSA